MFLTVVTMILASPPSTIVKALTIPSSKLKNRYTGHFRDIEADTSLPSKFFGKRIRANKIVKEQLH